VPKILFKGRITTLAIGTTGYRLSPSAAAWTAARFEHQLPRATYGDEVGLSVPLFPPCGTLVGRYPANPGD
jgi:hypothetical protein